MKKLDHPNLVNLKFYFYTQGDSKDELFINLVMDYMPQTLYFVTQYFSKRKIQFPVKFIKVYMYQMFRGIAYMHARGITHRDIKPQNVLVDPEVGTLQVCDFGCAKMLQGEKSVSYICSRYYRAPELLFGSEYYDEKIDLWSTGCVLAEIFLGRPVFTGDSGVDQLLEIFKILGAPSIDEVHAMNPSHKNSKFPAIESYPWEKLFKPETPAAATDLVSQLLRYTPQERITPLQACCHEFFNCLRVPRATLPNGKPLPPLFNFSPEELAVEPELNQVLIPPHISPSRPPKSPA